VRTKVIVIVIKLRSFNWILTPLSVTAITKTFSCDQIYSLT